MSNEMNLYKRCKNIFKTHGVDMGGGGSGGSVVYIDVVLDTSTGELTSDVTLLDIQTAFHSGARIIAKLNVNGYVEFLPLVTYTESGQDQASPYDAGFGSYVCNADTGRNVPLLYAHIDTDGATLWEIYSE